MKRVLVSIVCITLAITLLGLAGAPDKAAAQKDTLVVGMTDESQSLDPAISYDLTGWGILNHVYEGLVDYRTDDPSHIVPQLAESWEVGADGKTWTFHLRKGAVFASGNPITADAVVFSLRRFVKLASGPSWLLTQFGITEDSITKVDDETIQIVLDQQYAPFLFLSCAGVNKILDPQVVLAHEQDDDLGSAWLYNHSAGSGLYIIEERQRGTQLVLKANERYRGPKAPFTRVFIKHVPDPAEQAALLQAGELDVAWDLTPDEIQMLAGDPTVQIFESLGGNIIHLSMNLQYAPFSSSEVRDAVRYAIDYDGIVDYVFGGAAIKNQSFIPKGLLGYTSETPYIRDVDKARQLLRDGGYPEGFEVELACLEFSPWLELALKLKEDLAEIGVTVHVKPQTVDGLAGTGYHRRDFQMFIWEWWSDYPDPDSNAKAFAFCEDTGDDAAIQATAWGAHYENLETSKLVQQAVQEPDQQKRQAMYEQITAIILDDGPFAFLGTPIRHYAVRTEVVPFINVPDVMKEAITEFPPVR